ncbi:11717_t:CDS:2 [Acaulospora morrowiae]|uniref:11717_t:CDS:1 n=1 Tax=Acaulospora morrowiae TaxID=94023 RepID=A0A9N9DXG6_9GLOM|nr:11717_t:CDS:2 [Acaulospora morrowiae]
MSQEKPVKKLSRHARYNKKRRLEKEKNSTLLADNINLTLTTTNIIFNPNKKSHNHYNSGLIFERGWLFSPTQFATRGLHTSDEIYYIEKEWKIIPLCSSDCVASKGAKVRKKISTRGLLIEPLIREASLTRDNPQSYNEISYIPPKFLKLLDREINQDRSR